MFHITVDTRAVERALKKTEDAIKSEMANMLNRVGREGRNVFNEAAAREVGVVGSVRKFTGTAVEELNRAAPDRLEVKFTPSSHTANMGKLKYTGGRRREPLVVATHGSKTFSEGFNIAKKGAAPRLVERTGPGRHDVKSLRTTKFRTLMGQEDSNPRAAWKGAVSLSLEAEAPKALARAFEKAGF